MRRVVALSVLSALCGCAYPDDWDADGVTEAAGDCDDLDAAVFPGATDACGDGVDADCDGGDPDCEPAEQRVLSLEDADFALFGDSASDEVGLDAAAVAVGAGGQTVLVVGVEKADAVGGLRPVLRGLRAAHPRGHRRRSRGERGRGAGGPRRGRL